MEVNNEKRIKELEEAIEKLEESKFLIKVRMHGIMEDHGDSIRRLQKAEAGFSFVIPGLGSFMLSPVVFNLLESNTDKPLPFKLVYSAVMLGCMSKFAISLGNATGPVAWEAREREKEYNDLKASYDQIEDLLQLYRDELDELRPKENNVIPFVLKKTPNF